MLLSPPGITARTIFTRFDPGRDCVDYLLAPPAWKSDNAEGWKSAEKSWKQRYGDWSVPDFLEASHDTRDRGHYRRTERESFLSRSRPRVSADLPPAGDLAFLALREMVNPLWEVLKGLEREPDQDVEASWITEVERRARTSDPADDLVWDDVRRDLHRDPRA